MMLHTGTRHAIIREAHRYKLTSGIEIPSSTRPRERLIRENVPKGPNVGAQDLGSDLIPIHLPVHLHLHLHRHLSLLHLAGNYFFLLLSPPRGEGCNRILR